jgi:hypothetical protein
MRWRARRESNSRNSFSTRRRALCAERRRSSLVAASVRFRSGRRFRLRARARVAQFFADFRQLRRHRDARRFRLFGVRQRVVLFRSDLADLLFDLQNFFADDLLVPLGALGFLPRRFFLNFQR